MGVSRWQGRRSWCRKCGITTGAVVTRSASAHGVPGSFPTWKGTSKIWHFRAEPSLFPYFITTAWSYSCLQTGVSSQGHFQFHLVPRAVQFWVQKWPRAEAEYRHPCTSQCLRHQLQSCWSYSSWNLFWPLPEHPEEVKSSTGTLPWGLGVEGTAPWALEMFLHWNRKSATFCSNDWAFHALSRHHPPNSLPVHASKP